MKKILALLFGLLLSSWSNGQIKTAENDLNDGIISVNQKDLIYNSLKVFPNNTEFAIALIENNKIKFFGFKKTSDLISPINNKEKIFEIGSISKIFTSTLLANYVIKNKIKLEDPIQKYFPFEIKTNKRITLKELANHSSGLPRLPSNLDLFLVDPDNPYKAYDLQKLKEYFSEYLVLKQEPGTKYEYSNLGAGTIGLILTYLTKMTYEELLEKNIFSKYCMINSTTNREEIKKKLVQGLNPDGKETPNWDFAILVGAGGILSSVNDLSKFAVAQFDDQNKELVLTQNPTLIINENMKIGLGWHILTNNKGEVQLWHNGGTGGYSSSIVLNIQTKKGVIILSNVSTFNKEMGNIDKLCFSLMESINN